jgi:hypothetical protein
MSPDNSTALNFLFRILMYESRFEEARPILQRYVAEKGFHTEAFQAWFDMASGKQDDGRRILRAMIARYKEGDSCGPMAIGYMRLGEFDKAFEFLEKAYVRREHHVLTLNIDPDWDPIRSDPRLGEIVSRIGLPN